MIKDRFCLAHSISRQTGIVETGAPKRLLPLACIVQYIPRDVSAMEKNEVVGLTQWAGLTWQLFIQSGGFE